MTSGVFVSWTPHGRSADLADRLGFHHLVVTAPSRTLVVRYLRQSWRTYRCLRQLAPAAVLVMQPPAPALVATIVAVGCRARVGADLHTGFFEDPKWSWFTAAGLRLLRNGFALVTNDELARRCADAGVRALVLHDLVDCEGSVPRTSGAGRPPRVVVPLSWSADEPVDQILSAAGSLPDVEVVLTGRAPPAVAHALPQNARLSGHVPDREYAQLLRSADVVLACTTRAHTMLRAGYEAMRHGTPLVTSDSPVLRRFFEESAAYTDNSSAATVAALRSVLGDVERFRRSVAEARSRRVAEQSVQLAALRRLLAGD